MKHLAILLAISACAPTPVYPQGRKNGFPVTQEQCRNLCFPMHVTLYNPMGEWYNGRPESPTSNAPACLCGTFPTPEQDDDK